ncbi:hypothetical protein V492_06624 [Pseudogymnoascus sp. VKM F-4246]|nr:hypothetical protein V492_06624 [Pseudogymnoascus sp. VKM F-4246]
MPPPSTIPDSDADSSSPAPDPSPVTSPERPGPSTTAVSESVAVRSAAAAAAGAGSRKRGASPTPTTADGEEAREDRKEPLTVTAAVGVGSVGGVEMAEGAVEPLSEEDREEERRVKRIEAIKARNKELEAEVEAMEMKLDAAKGKLKNPDAAATVKAHIRRLHAYNEIRDVGQGLIGMIAEQRGVRIRECYESGEFGVGAKD